MKRKHLKKQTYGIPRKGSREREMKTIKFSTKTKDGIIVIPRRYLQKIKNPVEVTLHFEDASEKAQAERKGKEIDVFFKKYRIDLSGFRFDRDEAGRRQLFS